MNMNGFALQFTDPKLEAEFVQTYHHFVQSGVRQALVIILMGWGSMIASFYFGYGLNSKASFFVIFDWVVYLLLLGFTYPYTVALTLQFYRTVCAGLSIGCFDCPNSDQYL